MHIVVSVALILSALVVLTFGLVGVLRDLLERSPHDIPLLEDSVRRGGGYQVARSRSPIVQPRFENAP